MRKLGFTLAEVLITLGIIGVIATLTMPTLMSNTAEREYSTALKKAISALTEAIQMNVALENTSFDELYDPSSTPAGVVSTGTDGSKSTASGAIDTELNSLSAFLANRMQTEKYVALGTVDVCSAGTAKAATGNCLDYSDTTAGAGDGAMFFRDGSAIIFNSSDVIDTHECTNANGDKVDCFWAIYDVNGVKKPNLIANCSGDKTKDSADERQGTSTCNKDSFIARDQYPIALYGMGAYPDSPAAEYMWNRK